MHVDNDHTEFYQRSKHFSVRQVLHALIDSTLKSALFIAAAILLRTLFGVGFINSMTDLIITFLLYFVFNLVSIASNSVRSIRISEQYLHVKRMTGTLKIKLSDAVTLSLIQPTWRTTFRGIFGQSLSIVYRNSAGMPKTLVVDLQQFENADLLRRTFEWIIAGRRTSTPDIV